MVRAAVLKGKDPVQLIAEMEKIDQMGKFILQSKTMVTGATYHDMGDCVRPSQTLLDDYHFETSQWYLCDIKHFWTVSDKQ